MKIAYLKRTRCNSGGTEKVVFNKTNYLLGKGYDVTLITTEFKDKPDFFPFSDRLKRVDLDINYSELKSKPFYLKLLLYPLKSALHKRRLRQVLLEEKFDIVVSMFGNEVYWINNTKDGSKKINEVHFARNFRKQLNDGSLSAIQNIISAIKNFKDLKAIRQFDLFAVLSNEDKPEWGELPNIRTMYNSVTIPAVASHLTRKRAIAVGRLAYQKGFDMLIDAWSIIHRDHPDWRLDIYGAGDDRELQQQIDTLWLGDVVKINPPTPEIYNEILDSSLYLMTSRYEGLPMVLLEANACGVPAVSFDCKCGPRDIIEDGKSGYLVSQGDIESFAKRVCEVIECDALRETMGARAREIIYEKFSEEVVMKQWEELFKKLINKEI
ncbi:MAG: glycosyltransferase family 4 protein [Rikenellaceae bacterium]